MLVLDFATGKIYCNHPGSQLKPLSIFIEDFIAERLKPDGMVAVESGRGKKGRKLTCLKVVHSVDYIASCQNDNHLKRFKMYVEMYVSVSIAEYPPLLVQRVLICKMSEGRVWEGCAFCRARGC